MSLGDFGLLCCANGTFYWTLSSGVVSLAPERAQLCPLEVDSSAVGEQKDHS